MKRSKVTLIILLLGLCCSVYLTTASSLEEEQGERAAESKTLLTNVKNRIQHFIVLMMENRSFDHLLGWLKQKDGRVEGLTGKEYNCVIPGQFEPGFPCVTVSQDAPEFSPGDPSHTFDAQVQQIFGYDKPVTVNVNQSEELMNGFVWNANNTGIPISTPMRMFTSQADSAPILNTLAQEFGLFNYWYTSGPLPTDPNRGFAMSGTSNGMINNFNGTLWSQQSYFNLLTQHNVSWQAFYDADLWALGYYQDMYLPENAVKIADIEVFFQQLRQQPASLPAFTWLQPRMLAHPQVGLPNWQHPDASLREGERLIKSVYEALRSSSLWENSALLITYDEHGGFFDHVPPPTQGIPSPDGVISSTNGYTFNTLGMRLPSVIVSPWIPKGLIINEPSPQQQPTPTSHFEGTSAIATANKLFSVPQYLTARHAWAATFEDLFTLLPVARQDTPATLPDLPPALPDAMHSQRQKPLNDHMAIQVQFYCTQNRLPSCPDPEQMNQGEASDFILQQLPVLLAKMKAPQQ